MLSCCCCCCFCSFIPCWMNLLFPFGLLLLLIWLAVAAATTAAALYLLRLIICRTIPFSLPFHFKVAVFAVRNVFLDSFWWWWWSCLQTHTWLFALDARISWWHLCFFGSEGVLFLFLLFLLLRVNRDSRALCKKSEPGLITFKLIIDEDAHCVHCVLVVLCALVVVVVVVPAELRMNTHTHTPLYVPLSPSLFTFSLSSSSSS